MGLSNKFFLHQHVWWWWWRVSTTTDNKTSTTVFFKRLLPSVSKTPGFTWSRAVDSFCYKGNGCLWRLKTIAALAARILLLVIEEEHSKMRITASTTTTFCFIPCWFFNNTSTIISYNIHYRGTATLLLSQTCDKIGTSHTQHHSTNPTDTVPPPTSTKQVSICC